MSIDSLKYTCTDINPTSGALNTFRSHKHVCACTHRMPVPTNTRQHLQNKLISLTATCSRAEHSMHTNAVYTPVNIACLHTCSPHIGAWEDARSTLQQQSQMCHVRAVPGVRMTGVHM